MVTTILIVKTEFNFAYFYYVKVQVEKRNVEDKERLIRLANKLLQAPSPTQL